MPVRQSGIGNVNEDKLKGGIEEGYKKRDNTQIKA